MQTLSTAAVFVTSYWLINMDGVDLYPSSLPEKCTCRIHERIYVWFSVLRKIATYLLVDASSIYHFNLKINPLKFQANSGYRITIM